MCVRVCVCARMRIRGLRLPRVSVYFAQEAVDADQHVRRPGVNWKFRRFESRHPNALTELCWRFFIHKKNVFELMLESDCCQNWVGLPCHTSSGLSRGYVLWFGSVRRGRALVRVCPEGPCSGSFCANGEFQHDANKFTQNSRIRASDLKTSVSLLRQIPFPGQRLLCFWHQRRIQDLLGSLWTHSWSVVHVSLCPCSDTR